MLDEKDLQILGQLIDTKLDPLKRDLAGVKGDISGINETISDMKRDITGMSGDILRMSNRISAINLELENTISLQLNVLAEGQKTILETLAPKNRVEALEDDMLFMKQVVKSLSQEITELKKAQ